MKPSKRKNGTIVGIDLAGSPKRNTGMCALTGKTVIACATVHTDDEIVRFIRETKPVLIAVDAPLSLPPGRKTIEDRSGGHFRAADRELLKRGIRFFPITLGPMRMLTRRGMDLKRVLKRARYDIIEIYPGAAQDIWKIGRKQKGLGQLRRGLARMGVRSLPVMMNGDELDAVTAALVGREYVKGRAEVLGSVREGAIVLPALRKKPKVDF